MWTSPVIHKEDRKCLVRVVVQRLKGRLIVWHHLIRDICGTTTCTSNSEHSTSHPTGPSPWSRVTWATQKLTMWNSFYWREEDGPWAGQGIMLEEWMKRGMLRIQLSVSRSYLSIGRRRTINGHFSSHLLRSVALCPFSGPRTVQKVSE